MPIDLGGLPVGVLSGSGDLGLMISFLVGAISANAFCFAAMQRF